MKLSIKIQDKLVEIILLKNSGLIDTVYFPENNNLSEKLLPAIDKLIKRNKLEPRDIKNVKARTDTPESFTTSRIAESVAKSFNFALRFSKKRKLSTI